MNNWSIWDWLSAIESVSVAVIAVAAVVFVVLMAIGE
jgi:hypothetical protein